MRLVDEEFINTKLIKLCAAPHNAYRFNAYRFIRQATTRATRANPRETGLADKTC
jgi:hypothetical protein